MYLQTANPQRAFTERPSVESGLHDSFSGFRSAEDPVYEGGFESVLKVLAGPSPWQQYILPNLAIAKRHLPRKPFNIVGLREYTDLMSNLGRSGTERNIPGFTDKRTGTITMQEWRANSKATFLGAALHEAVHLVSHPAEQGKPSTAVAPLGDGLLEGLVECITLDILKAQKIALAGPKMRGHEDRVPVAVALLRNLSIPLMARVLFAGDSGQFEAVVHHTYSVNGWHQIIDTTTANPTRAIQLMNDWRAKQAQVHRIQLEQQMRKIRSSAQPLGGFGQLADNAGSEVNQAIRGAKAKRDAALARYQRITAGGITTPEALQEKNKFHVWADEVNFLESLKPIYESQRGVSLNYTSYPVTKKDPVTGKSGANTPWRPSSTRQAFSSLEAGGSFCLGSSRAMAFRSLFGQGRPSNIDVLTKLKQGIETAKRNNDINTEARLVISRLVSHLHDPASLKQFNQDLGDRYGITNVEVRSADRKDALDALKNGAPIIADLEGGWHWVVVHRSPLGQLWANDPLSGYGIRKISASALGSRFELIVDATTGKPITAAKAADFKVR